MHEILPYLPAMNGTPVALDVICERIPEDRMTPGMVVRVNIPQYVVQHSPDGFEWGYGGSGPSDFALNVLHLHLPPGVDGKEPEKLYRGSCSPIAWELHIRFKAEVISRIPEGGGRLTVYQVREWIRVNWKDSGPYRDAWLRFHHPYAPPPVNGG